MSVRVCKLCQKEFENWRGNKSGCCSLECRFFSKIDKDGPLILSEPCWIWTAGRTRLGYGKFQLGVGESVFAHRFAWELENGPIPDRLCALHKCDNPSCVRPDHLYVGTQADNIRDRDERGRTATGDRNGSRTKPESRPRGDRNGSRTKPESRPRGDRNGGGGKLTEADILAIRTLYEIRVNGKRLYSQRKLASQFGVGKSLISYIVRREMWAHVASLRLATPHSGVELRKPARTQCEEGWA